MEVKYDFAEKHFLVTGASSGIGRATAVLLGQCGAKVSVVARREDMLKETISLMPNNNHKAYICDLCKTEEIENLMKEIVLKNGALSGLVYCAGVAPSRPLKMTQKKRYGHRNDSKFLFICRIYALHF